MLLHAGYSASESLAYEKSVDPSSPLQIPLDVCLCEVAQANTSQIRVETVVSVILLCLAVILGSAQMKPVKWREWTNQQEREAPGFLPHVFVVDKQGNQYP